MTAVIGYIYKGTANIVVDSAQTFLKHPLTKIEKGTSPFDENYFIDDSKTVTDGLQKLFDLGRGVLAAFAGSIYEGQNVLDDLRKVLNYNDQRVTVLLETYLKQNHFTHTDFLFALHEDGTPIIIYRTRKEFGIFSTGVDSVFLGSIVDRSLEFNRVLVDSGIEAIKKSAKTAPEALVAIVGFAQLVFINNPALEAGIGGTFNGAYVDRTGVKWAPDTFYFVYSSKNFDKYKPFLVSKYNRDGGTITGTIKERSLTISPIASKALVSEVLAKQKVGLFQRIFKRTSDIGLDIWLSKWDALTLEMNKTAKAEYYLTLSNDRLIMAIVGPDTIGKHLKVTVEKGIVDFGFSEDMMKSMLWSHEKDDPLNPVLRFNFCRPIMKRIPRPIPERRKRKRPKRGRR